MKLSLVLLIAFLCTIIRPSNELPASPQDQVYRTDAKLEASTGIPRALYFQKKGPYRGTAEEKAKQYLLEEVKTLRLTPGLPDLATANVAESPMGQHVTFQQTFNDIPVYRSDIVVSIDRGDRVVFTVNNYKPKLQLVSTTPGFQGSAALQYARSYLKVTGKLIGEESATLMVYAENPKQARLAYRVIVPTEKPLGDWEVFVDASTGEVFSVIDMAQYERPHRRAAAKPAPQAGESPGISGVAVNGTGYVFDPDPLTSTGSAVGGGYVDGNDADTPQLDSARVLVTLMDITLAAGKYSLTGPYVKLEDFETPNDTFATPASADSFRFRRSQQAFEEVMIYYHVDKSQRYIQSLGFNSIQNLSIGVDPHGLNNADNSHYIPSQNRMAFGEGGVDDAEDADVIWHEYGHAIHNGTKPGWSTLGGEARHIGEGFGDYWAGSYSKANWAAGADQVFNWDGLGGLRPLNNPAHYPRNGVAAMEVHDAGEIWASVLMLLWDDLGRAVMDKLVLQSHYMIGANPTMRDNACAIIQADRSLNGGSHVTALLNRFIERGFLRVDIEFVIDDTGSMEEEIGGIRDALTTFLSTFSEDTCLIFQLTTFKDNVSSRALTINLGEIRNQVASLYAAGGADCPEASVEALNAVKDTIRNGGVILFATDADPHAGLNLNSTISNLRARGIRVNVLLSGACMGAPGAGPPEAAFSDNRADGAEPRPANQVNPVIGPDGHRYRRGPASSDTLILGGNDNIQVALPFPFAFAGKTYDSAFVHSDGYITFGEPLVAYDVNTFAMMAGPRMIAGLWVDLNPGAGGTITAMQVGPDFHIAYQGVPTNYYAVPVSFTIILRPDNTFRVDFGSVNVNDALIGFSAGNSSASAPEEEDFSAAAQPIGSTSLGTAYEYFFPDSCDMSSSSVEFSAVTYLPPTGTITGLKFNDLNGNGVRDSLEPGIDHWEITVSGPVYRSTFTDSLGNYVFDDLPTGYYYVQENTVGLWSQTYPSTYYYYVMVDSGGTVTGNDFGNFLGSSISGYVFFDKDSSGSLTGGDPNISGWMVYIDGPETDSLTAYFSYEFTGLGQGTYTVTMEQRPGWTQTGPPGGSYTVQIDSAGSSETGKNFGVIAPLGGISGTVFHDKNGSGTRDPGEEGLGGTYIYISGPEFVYQTTDSAGNFSFTDLIPGELSLSPSLPSGYVLTVGGGTMTLAPGEVISGMDIGAYIPPNSIEAFSRIAAETGGFFAYVPEVNSGDTNDVKRFKNIALNIVQGGITKSVGLAQPSEVPVGGNVLLTVTGSNTNFISAAVAPATVNRGDPNSGGATPRNLAGTGISITGDGITVNSVTVISPIQLVADVSVDPGATPGFRDIIAISDFGGGVFDTAVGLGTLEVGAAPPGPTILSVSPPVGAPGTVVVVTITGISTSFADTSILNMGTGIAVSGITAISPTKLQATLTIDPNATLGFKNISVTTGSEFAGESVPGPFLLVSVVTEIALIADVTPANAMQGDSLMIAVTGLNTNFDSALTTVSFSGSGIYVQAIRILSATQLEADIVVDSMAPPGYRDVFVSTGVEDATALSAFNIAVLPTDVSEEERPLPTRYTLAQAFPNPFNPTTTIRYELPASSLVKLTVYNTLGQVVGVLADGIQEAGYRDVVWNASKIASGVYIYKLEAVSLSDPGKSFTRVMKMVLMK